MLSRCSGFLFVLGFGLLLTGPGCQKAKRYDAVREAPGPSKGEKDAVNPDYGWLKGEPLPDIPLVFVTAEAHPEEWKALPKFFNEFPPPGGGMETMHFGLKPLNSVVALVSAAQIPAMKIKVPAGLSDPTPFIPASNPPTLLKWSLGRDLFFDPGWLTDLDILSCATCHNPKNGFVPSKADFAKYFGDRPLKGSIVNPLNALMNPPTLINSAYNKHQFWDGRVLHLEQVVQRQLEDEAAETSKKSYIRTHTWGGIIPRLKLSKYRDGFQKVFGIPEPTTDAVGKALATYMRTILSGNSLYDQAQQAAAKEPDKKLRAKHFLPLLNDKTLTALQRELEKPDTVAEELIQGHDLFFAKKCQQCHGGWNFTDNSFHNIGIRESRESPYPGDEVGHFRHQPYGVKNIHMMGAFKTPSLRNLPRMAPYFHDASAASLEEVLEYYNLKMFGAPLNPHLDPLWTAGTPWDVRKLDLTVADVRALAVFLRALDGEPVAVEVVTPPTKKK